MPVIQTTGAGTATWVSAADMMSLMALILGMFGELTFLILSLWLLFRTLTPELDNRVGNALQKRRIPNFANIGSDALRDRQTQTRPWTADVNRQCNSSSS